MTNRKPDIGHNSGTDSNPRSNNPPGAGADQRLRLLIERIERLTEEKDEVAIDIREVFAEAKATGYDAKIMRQIIRLRKMDPQARIEMELLVDTYKAAVGLD